jgi:DNA invertase Pin-like site-specific DNA recombinase
VSLNEGIDATTPAGRLQMAVLGAIALFERERIAERVKAGLARARAQGKRVSAARALRRLLRASRVSPCGKPPLRGASRRAPQPGGSMKAGARGLDIRRPVAS